MQLPTTHYFGLQLGLAHLVPVSLAVIVVIGVLGGALALTLRHMLAATPLKLTLRRWLPGILRRSHG